MLASIVKRDTGARDEVLYGSRNDHVARTCSIHDARREMNGNSENFRVGPLDLAGMQTGTDLDAERDHGFHDRLSAMDRARGAIEQDEKSISQRFHFAAAEARHFPANCCVVRLQQFAPGLVS